MYHNFVTSCHILAIRNKAAILEKLQAFVLSNSTYGIESYYVLPERNQMSG